MMNLEINKAVKYLKDGKTILCPTDTIWGISCDATNYDAVEKIYEIKSRDKSKSLIILVNSFQMLKQYIDHVPQSVNSIIEKQEKPLTIIYDKAQNIAANTYAEDASIAVRIVAIGFCNKLITAFGKPIISTSANFSNKETAQTFQEIDKNLIDRIDFVVNNKFETSNDFQSSSIIKLEGNKIIRIRK